MYITNDFLLNIRTKKGGYTKRQLEILDIDWPPIKDWKKTIIGNIINQNQYDELLEISNKSK